MVEQILGIKPRPQILICEAEEKIDQLMNKRVNIQDHCNNKYELSSIIEVLIVNFGFFSNLSTQSI